MNKNPQMNIDFRADWVAILKAEICSLGYKVDPKLDTRSISETYFNLQRLRISATPRMVLISREFSCPADLTSGLELIKDKASKGEDLRPHQSCEFADPNYNDRLLNDWDIHHLHLGIQIQANGFVERTGPVLFARVTHDTFYLLDVMHHGHGHQPWIKKILVEIIHKNWPDSIAECRLKGIVDIEFNPSEQEIGQLRKANINTMLKMDDGTIYGPLGGGFIGSGISLEVVEESNYHFHLIDRIERYVKDNHSGLMNDAVASGVKISNQLHFRLIGICDDSVSIYEQNSRTLFRIALQK